MFTLYYKDNITYHSYVTSIEKLNERTIIYLNSICHYNYI